MILRFLREGVLYSAVKYWAAILILILVAVLMIQWEILGQRKAKINGQSTAIVVLNNQLLDYQAKARVMDKLRRAMHHETVTLRDELRERSQVSDNAVELRMAEPVRSDRDSSLDWLREQIDELGWRGL